MKTAIAAAIIAVLQANLPMRSLDKGASSQIDTAKQVSASTADEWRRLWAQHAGGSVRPKVDFSKEVVAAVFLGSRPTAGYGVEIARARQQGTILVVSYKETRPAPDSVAAQVLTAPYDIVAIQKGSTTGVTFERIE